MQQVHILISKGSAGRYLDNIEISRYINQHDNHIIRKMLLTIISKDRAIKDGLYNNLVFVMQLYLFVIATQVYTCYMNNQLLQKENIPGKD